MIVMTSQKLHPAMEFILEMKIYRYTLLEKFTKAALGAEGIGKDVKMLIGCGYAKNHAEISLDLVRESDVLLKIFKEKYI